MKKFKWQILIKTTIFFSLLFAFFLILNIKAVKAVDGACGSSFTTPNTGTIDELFTTRYTNNYYGVYKYYLCLPSPSSFSNTSECSLPLCADATYKATPTVSYPDCYNVKWNCDGDNSSATTDDKTCIANRIVDGQCDTQTDGKSIYGTPTALCTFAKDGCPLDIIPPGSDQDGSQAKPWKWACCPTPWGGEVDYCSACNQYHHWTAYATCVPNTCQGNLSRNGVLWSSDENINIVNNTTSYVYKTANTSAKCEYYCNSTSHWNGTDCVNNYNCSGTLSTGAIVFSNDDIELTANTNYSYSVTNTAAKCEFSCDSYNNYVWDPSSSSCVKVSCQGNPPSGTASLYWNDDRYLTANTNYAYSATDTAAKCEFYCKDTCDRWGRNCMKNVWDEATKSCVALPYSCMNSAGGTNLPAHAVVWDAEESSGLTSYINWTYAYPDTSTKCQYYCETGYAYNNISKSCVCSGTTFFCNHADTGACNDQSNCGRSVVTGTAFCTDECSNNVDISKCNVGLNRCVNNTDTCPPCSNNGVEPGDWIEVAP